jgi:hypothetical protein
VPCLPIRHFPKYVSAYSIAQKNPNDYAIFSENVIITHIRIPHFTCNLTTNWKFKGRRHSTKNSAERGYHHIPCIHQWTIWEFLRINIRSYVRTSVYPSHPASHKRRMVEKGEYARCFSCRENPGKFVLFLYAWIGDQVKFFPIIFSIKKALGPWRHWVSNLHMLYRNYCNESVYISLRRYIFSVSFVLW